MATTTTTPYSNSCNLPVCGQAWLHLLLLASLSSALCSPRDPVLTSEVVPGAENCVDTGGSYKRSPQSSKAHLEETLRQGRDGTQWWAVAMWSRFMAKGHWCPCITVRQIPGIAVRPETVGAQLCGGGPGKGPSLAKPSAADALPVQGQAHLRADSNQIPMRVTPMGAWELSQAGDQSIETPTELKPVHYPPLLSLAAPHTLSVRRPGGTSVCGCQPPGSVPESWGPSSAVLLITVSRATDRTEQDRAGAAQVPPLQPTWMSRRRGTTQDPGRESGRGAQGHQ